MANGEGTRIPIRQVTGEMLNIPFGDVTALEWRRKLVAEDVTAGKAHAEKALERIELLPKVTWLLPIAWFFIPWRPQYQRPIPTWGRRGIAGG